MVEYQQQPVHTASAVNLLKVRQSLQADHTESGWLSDQLHHQRGIERERPHAYDDYQTPEALYCVEGLLVQPTLTGTVDYNLAGAGRGT